MKSLYNIDEERGIVMNFYVPVGISNRHVHLNKETYSLLFDEEPKKIADLKQGGEFVTDKVVSIEGPCGTIENVKVLGPLRAYNQVEISSSDAFKLGLHPPVRRSGKLQRAEDITVVHLQKRVSLKEACIMAECHIHMNFDDLKHYGVEDDEVVDVVINGPRKGIMKAHIKASENGFLEFHVDRDEASAFLLENQMELEVIRRR